MKLFTFSTEDDTFSIFYCPSTTASMEYGVVGESVLRCLRRKRGKQAKIRFKVLQQYYHYIKLLKIIFTLDRNTLAFYEGLVLQIANII